MEYFEANAVVSIKTEMLVPKVVARVSSPAHCHFTSTYEIGQNSGCLVYAQRQQRQLQGA
jgi:hypothetical protein